MLEEYHKCKSELDTLYDYITAGLIIRSKSNWYEQGEKSSKYFLNSGALWQGSSTENSAKSLKLSRMTAGYFIDTKFDMVTHTVNSDLKPLLFFKKVT